MHSNKKKFGDDLMNKSICFVFFVSFSFNSSTHFCSQKYYITTWTKIVYKNIRQGFMMLAFLEIFHKIVITFEVLLHTIIN